MPNVNRILAAAAITSAVIATIAAPPAPALATSAGDVFSFGLNTSGELGITMNAGTSTPNPSPSLVSVPFATGPVTEVAAGQTHTLAVTSTGQLYAFGDNYYGELGNATDNGNSTVSSTPALVTLPGATGGVKHVAAGSGFSLAVTSTGQLYAFGQNQQGQLGNTTNVGTQSANPTPTLVVLPGATGGVTQVAAGGLSSLAVTSTGQLFAFGDNFYGQLGNTDNNWSNTANQSPALVTLPGATGPVTYVSSGNDSSFAVTSTGQLFAFGLNSEGELGNATNNNGTPNPTPTLVTLPGASGGVSRVAGGDTHTLALTTSGQLYGFGDNFYGELGTANHNDSGAPNPTPTLVPLPGQQSPVSQVAAGVGTSAVVTRTGQLYTFGDNQYGALGRPANSGNQNPNPLAATVALPAGTTIDAVAQGSVATDAFAIVSDLAITTGSLPAGRVGVPYHATVQATGGTKPLTFSAFGLPPGMSINAASGAISGIPTTAGGFSMLAFDVQDAYNGVIAKALPITIAQALPPALTHIRQSHRKWRRGGSLATVTTAGKAPIGTTFYFTLNEPARVRLAFTQLRQGHVVTRGALSFTSHSGKHQLSFAGRISHSKKLKPGDYTVLITANKFGKRSHTHALSFTIVK